MRRPAFLLALLVYVALDFSFPEMPGAFVFELSESVESSRNSGRAAIKTVELPAARHMPVAEELLRSDRSVGPVMRPTATSRWEPLVTRLPRSLGDPARPSEDPH